MKTKWSALVALLLLLSMLCACAAEPAATPTPTPDSTNSASVEDSADSEPDPAPAEDSTPAENPSNNDSPVSGAALPDETGNIPRGFAEGTIGYPICEPGEITLEYWRSAGDYVLQDGDRPFANNYAWAAMEEATGIHVDFSVFSAQAYSTQYSLMLASQEYPDVAVGGSYSGGGEQAVEDDVYVDLAEYVEEYAPNYLRWVNLTEGNRKNAYTDSGIMYTFCQVYDRTQSAFLGYGIRQDWLDDLGMDKPATINEWHDTLVAFRDQKTGGAAPMEFGSSGFTFYSFLEGAWNVSGNSGFGGELGLIQKDGIVSCSLQSEDFRNYLETMRNWYAEGLINHDFPAVWLYDADRLMANESGVFQMFYTQAGDYLSLIAQAPEGAYVTLLDQPVLDDGTERHIYGLGEYSAGLQYAQAVVFADSDIITEAIRWCDWLYSEDGYMMSNYGVEGVTFNYDENGHPMLTELVANNPDIPGIGNSMEYYLIHNGNVVFLLDREEDQQSEESLTYNELWNDRGDWNISGLMSYTAEEGEERSALVTDLSTLVTEFTCKVIMGETELNDDSWNTFQRQLSQMNIERVVEITQASYSRYLAR